MMTKKKDFDCVEMQDREALRIYDELKGKTREEQLAYWQRINEKARRKYPQLREINQADLS